MAIFCEMYSTFLEIAWELAGIGCRLGVRVLVIPFLQTGFKFSGPDIGLPQ